MPKTRKLGRGVAMVGAGMSKFGAFPDKSSRDLFVEAFQSMRGSVDKGFDPADIETIYIGNFSSDLFESQSHTAPIMADVIGLASRPATRIEDACASSGVAMRQGILAIASGLYDMVLVGGDRKDDGSPHRRGDRYLGRRRGYDLRNPGRFHVPWLLRRHRIGVHAQIWDDA
jgi:acetyl-CoA C-acetyltransferase